MLHTRFILGQINNSRKQATVFVLCVALSLLTLTSLGSFSSNVRNSVLKDARQLQGGDIIIHSHSPFSQNVISAIDTYRKQGLLTSTLIHTFYSMARNPVQNKSILCQLKIIDKEYPLYGNVQLDSGATIHNRVTKGFIVVEQGVLDRLQAKIGDTLQIGNSLLTIAAVVMTEPDRPVSFFSFGPRVFISSDDLKELDLIKKGSRIHFKYLLKVNNDDLVNKLADEIKNVAVADREQVQTFQQASSRIKRFFENFLFFLNLIGLFTLLLSGIGIQTCLHALLQESNHTIAIIKSIGADSRFITIHFITIILLLGATGTLLGLALSSILQLFLPTIFTGLIPITVTMNISFSTIFNGLFLGFMVVILFSFLPLYRLKNLKPAFIFSKEMSTSAKDGKEYCMVGVIILFFVGLIIWQLEDIKIGIYVIFGLFSLLSLTTLITHGLLLFLKNVSPGNLAIRQAFRGLFRPGNSTRAIIITLSASLAVIFSLYLIENNLRSTFIESYPPQLPNAYFLDIQPEQKNAFSNIIGMELQYYPVIRARLSSINNIPVDAEKEQQRKRDNLSREFNLTYREHLLEDERLVVGDTLFRTNKNQLQQLDEIPVSILDTVAEFGNIKIGDLLVFKIQGFPLKARVTSMRTRTVSKLQPFFYFVFQEKTLIDMPLTFFSAAKMDQALLFQKQNQLAKQLPNISVIDIGSTIKILAEIMNKMSLIIQFFSSFSIIAGLLIIISSTFATRLSRIREAVYYKVLGAKTTFVYQVFLYENLLIAFICAVLASIISQTGSWIVCKKIFAISYQPLPVSTAVMIGSTLLLIVTIGLIATISILQQKPVSFLRNEENQ